MSIEPDNQFDAEPWRECPECCGDGTIQTRYSTGWVRVECPRCHGSGCVPDDYEPCEDDYQ